MASEGKEGCGEARAWPIDFHQGAVRYCHSMHVSGSGRTNRMLSLTLTLWLEPGKTGCSAFRKLCRASSLRLRLDRWQYHSFSYPCMKADFRDWPQI